MSVPRVCIVCGRRTVRLCCPRCGCHTDDDENRLFDAECDEPKAEEEPDDDD